MRIDFSPQYRDDTLTLSKQGDVLTINGEDFDFTALPEGATLPREAIASPWLVSDVKRLDGVLQLTLILPTGPNSSPAANFPEPVTVTADGPIGVPQ